MIDFTPPYGLGGCDGSQPQPHRHHTPTTNPLCSQARGGVESII
jgi:hypothetical protein